MKTQSNSSPLAEWIVMSWTASCPAWAWLSPASSEAWVRKAASGDMISPVSASGDQTRRRDDLAAGHDLGAGRRVFGAAGGPVESRAGEGGEAAALARFIDRQRDRVLAEAFLGHEGLGRVDQLLEVLEPLLALAIGLVEIDQARGLEHVDDDLAQVEAAGGGAHGLDALGERHQVVAALAGQRADALPQAAPARARRILQLLERARADAASREVHHAQEAGVVVAVLDQAQVGERMLHLGPFEEAQAAVHLVRDVGVEKRALHDPALRIAAVEQRDLVARRALAVQLLGFLDEPLRLGKIAGRLVNAHRLTRAGLGAQVLAEAARVLRDELVGGVEDVAVGAVVALEA